MDKPDRSPPAEPTHISPADCPNYYDHCRCAPTPEAPQADDVVRDLRNAAARLRRTPMPLSDVIPLLQRAADRIESDAARIRELEAKNARLTIDSGYYADNADAAMKWYENAERELAASRERERALREALREVAIARQSGNAIFPMTCLLCAWQAWKEGEAERHAPGCLVAPDSAAEQEERT